MMGVIDCNFAAQCIVHRAQCIVEAAGANCNQFTVSPLYRLFVLPLLHCHQCQFVIYFDGGHRLQLLLHST